MVKKIVMHDQVPGFIEPTPIVIDVGKLRRAMLEINAFVGYQPSEAFTSFNKKAGICLTHPPVIPQSVIDEWGDVRSKFVGPMSDGEPALRRNFGMTTAQFTEMHPIVQSSYIKEIVDQLQAYTQTRFGSGKICWIHSGTLSPGATYHMHKDDHCIGRYHIVEYTTEYSYMMVEEGYEIKTVYLPADGRVWFLDTNVNHNAMNLTPMEDIRISEKLRTHLILSIYEQAGQS
jgi:hypothetical protein